MSGTRVGVDGYAGDVTPGEAWNALKADVRAILVDCRSAAEWTFVGQPDLSSLGRKPVNVPWQIFPGMVRNELFVDEVRACGVDAEQSIYCLCRSGARSMAAARALTAAGLGPCFNIAGGFEGDLDEQKHRGRSNGWKKDGLPWVQS